MLCKRTVTLRVINSLHNPFFISVAYFVGTDPICTPKIAKNKEIQPNKKECHFYR